MELVNEACILNLIMTSIFLGERLPAVDFDWDFIKGIALELGDKFNRDDARVLLQLSLMVTSSNTRKKPLVTPAWLQDTPISYDGCPLKNIGVSVSKEALTEKGVLAHVFYSEKANIVFIVFTGTSNACLIGLDVEYDQTYINELTNYSDGMKAHHGIYAGYKAVREQIIDKLQEYLPKNPRLVITGHSLGAALANLCALDLAYYQPSNYSFAGPGIFNLEAYEAFQQLVPKAYRVANLSDIVVMTPLPIMPNKDIFYHVGELIHFQRNYGEYSYNHSLSYVEEFQIPYTVVKN